MLYKVKEAKGIGAHWLIHSFWLCKQTNVSPLLCPHQCQSGQRHKAHKLSSQSRSGSQLSLDWTDRILKLLDNEVKGGSCQSQCASEAPPNMISETRTSLKIIKIKEQAQISTNIFVTKQRTNILLLKGFHSVRSKRAKEYRPRFTLQRQKYKKYNWKSLASVTT